MTARQAAEIAEGCRAYLAAHGKRPPGDPLATITERSEAARLHDLLVPIVRKPCPPAAASAA